MHERDIFNTARQIAAAGDREAYLDKACGDPDVRRRVDELLLAHDQAGSFLQHPCVDGHETIATERNSEPLESGEHVNGNTGEIALDFLSASDAPGVLGLIGLYEVTEVLGSGGMGIVLKARDARLNRVVAVKVLAPKLAGNAMARRRFVREAQAVAAVAHPHIVAIYSVDEDRLPYLVMEFVDGPSLQEKIDREGHLELREILRIGAQIAAGLAAAHAQGVIHRDIKPANILLENGVERVRITDFGLARAVDDVAMTRTGEVTGTPQYMSPEQSQGLPVDARTDLFSLGSVLYAMCTGRSPFRADTTMACLRRVCDDTPRPIREVNPDVPEWLGAIINRLLEKDPGDRLQTALEVSELLGKHLAHVQDPASTPFPGMVRPAMRVVAAAPGRRRRSLAAALLLIALAAGFSVTEATGVTGFSSTVVRIVTGEGTLVIEVDDPTVQVSLNGEALSITGAGLSEITLRPGQYQFEAVKNGQPVKQELVTITRGGRRVVSVSMEGVRVRTPKSADGQWTSLFNGRDLTGWMTHPSNPSGWTVKDGLLVGSGSPRDAYLFSDRNDFENFHLRIEAQINGDADSGVFLRSEFGLSMKSWRYPAPFAYEVQIAGVNPNNSDQTGTLSNTAAGTLVRREEVLFPPDTWQTLEIVARGNRVIVKGNGEEIADYVDDSRAHSKGHVTLQAARAAGVVRFRKIEIQELRSDSQSDDPYDASGLPSRHDKAIDAPAAPVAPDGTTGGDED